MPALAIWSELMTVCVRSVETIAFVQPHPHWADDPKSADVGFGRLWRPSPFSRWAFRIKAVGMNFA